MWKIHQYSRFFESVIMISSNTNKWQRKVKFTNINNRIITDSADNKKQRAPVRGSRYWVQSPGVMGP